MYKLSLLLFALLFISLSVNAQEKSAQKKLMVPSSIYYSSFEKVYGKLDFNELINSAKWDYKFLWFDEPRLEANLSNTLSFRSFSTKPTKYYLDTYKKLYNLKGQTQTFLKIEQLYEVPPQYIGN